MERKPLEVLALLLRHAGEVVTRDELIESVWVGRVTVDNVLANAIAKLRKALGETNAEHLLTQPRVGYRLAAPVERVAVGRKLASRLDLVAGTPVPTRPHFILQRQLGSSHGSELARGGMASQTASNSFCVRARSSPVEARPIRFRGIS